MASMGDDCPVNKSSHLGRFLAEVATCSVPAKICSKNVEQLVSGQEGVEHAAVCAVNHVALLR